MACSHANVRVLAESSFCGRCSSHVFFHVAAGGLVKRARIKQLLWASHVRHMQRAGNAKARHPSNADPRAARQHPQLPARTPAAHVCERPLERWLYDALALRLRARLSRCWLPLAQPLRRRRRAAVRHGQHVRSTLCQRSRRGRHAVGGVGAPRLQSTGVAGRDAGVWLPWR